MLLEFQFQSWRWICREQEGMVPAAQTEHLGCSRHLRERWVHSANICLLIAFSGTGLGPHPGTLSRSQASGSRQLSFPCVFHTSSCQDHAFLSLLACLFCQPGGSWRSGPGVLSVSMSQAAGTQQVLRKRGRKKKKNKNGWLTGCIMSW